MIAGGGGGRLGRGTLGLWPQEVPEANLDRESWGHQVGPLSGHLMGAEHAVPSLTSKCLGSHRSC